VTRVVSIHVPSRPRVRVDLFIGKRQAALAAATWREDVAEKLYNMMRRRGYPATLERNRYEYRVVVRGLSPGEARSLAMVVAGYVRRRALLPA